VEWSGVEWSGVEWSGVEWSGVEWSGEEWRHCLLLTQHNSAQMKIPPFVLNSIFNLFSEKLPNGSFAFATQSKQKRTIFSMLLLLLGAGEGDNTSPVVKLGNCADFLESIQIECKDAANLMKQAGCLCKKGTGASSALAISVKAPVTFPQNMRARGK